jgi:hypothetical protein
MAAPIQIHGRTHPQELASFALKKVKLPDKQIQLPLAPPTTDDRFSNGSDRSAVHSAMQIFRRHQEHFLIDPWTSIQLKPTQYERVPCALIPLAESGLNQPNSANQKAETTQMPCVLLAAEIPRRPRLRPQTCPRLLLDPKRS